MKDCWYKTVCTNTCSDSCIRYSEMKYLMDNSGIPEKRQYPDELIADNDLQSFLKLADIKDDIVNFVNSGENLYICSKFTGNGKTSWAIKLMLKYFDEIWAGNGFRVRGLFLNVPTTLIKLKDFNDPSLNELKNTIIKTDLVIWDDIAASYMTNYDLSQLLIYIDQRILMQKANIFTGNLTDESQLIKLFGDRLASRIWNCSQVIEFRGKDRRGTVTDNQ